jgi:hypothetical protein
MNVAGKMPAIFDGSISIRFGAERFPRTWFQYW